MSSNIEQTKSEFLANICHEIRTPLNIIMGSQQLIKLYVSDPATAKDNIDKIFKYSSILEQNCNRLLKLANNLIDITKYESNFYELSLSKVNIISLVKDITQSVNEYVENKGITLVFKTDLDKLDLICDPCKIERVILNLLSNAVKFTDSGGFIKVMVFGNLDDTVSISVEDTGIGIPADKLNIIFDRYKQIDESCSRNFHGSGIGLSLVKSIVEMHNGKISVSSEYGKGSIFTIALPLYKRDMPINNYYHSCEEETKIEFSDIFLK